LLAAESRRWVAYLHGRGVAPARSPP